MKQKHLMIIAIACGAVCAGCIIAFMLSVQGEANAARSEALSRYGGEQVEVCVATRDIAAGERVDAAAVESRLWIADLLPDGALRENSEALGRTATTSILKGEVICEARFATSHSDFEIPKGKEAVSVPAKTVQAVGGAITPGMSVDVYASGDSSTTALVRDVLVLDTSVGGSGSFVSSDAGCITLAVDPDRVEEIIAASSKTNLYFVIPGQHAEQAASKEDEPGEASRQEPGDGLSEGEPEVAQDAAGQEATTPESATLSEQPSDEVPQEDEASQE